MMASPMKEANGLGQSIWYDNIQRSLLTSGEMARLIELGVTGVTSNPTIFEKAIAGSADYDDALLLLARAHKGVVEAYESLAIEDIRATVDLLRPVYDRTSGADGFASLEVSPSLAHDTEGTVSEGRRLFATVDRPNLMVKVPATPEGAPAIRRLIGEGININVTLIFSLDAYRQVREAYIAGLEDLARSGGEVSKVASVASFFVSRVDTAVDSLLEERIRQGQDGLRTLLGKAAVANAKLAYQAFKDTFQGDRFAALQAKGARVQRPLWASTGTKNPDYSDVMYVESLMGPETVNTMPPATLTAFLEHGSVALTLDQGVDEARADIEAISSAGISMKEVTAKLLTDGVKSFGASFDELIANIEEKKTQLLANDQEYTGMRLGELLSDVEAAVKDLDEQDLVGRIWRRDYTIWKPDPKEIIDRLGWLTISGPMSERLPAMEDFSREVRDVGFGHVVLLGMGGSSLGSEVFRQTFGKASGYPELIVLDSTVPAWVQRVTDAVDPARTLFLVSSKSGGTTEPLSFYRHFRGLVEEAIGTEKAGQNFVAITDPGTGLERLATERGFRRVFLNPPDIGGRYSVLSYFGLVPAVLMGLDITELLQRVDRMGQACASGVAAADNPGARLGVVMGMQAKKGRDKLTLITSPSVGSFGLWAEQLLAESTGKEGTGVIPVAGEPLASPNGYGDDRLFVYLRLDGDDNGGTDVAIERLEASGQPVVRLRLKDRYDLGAEFFRWEFATAVTGAVLGIHPFDQPDVQGAKDMTERMLKEYETSGRLPNVDAHDSARDMLSKARPGDYLAIMPYLLQTPEVDQALGELRLRVMERYRIATTLGYGPRYLHSTGQIHKGGPGTGLYLQITEERAKDLPIPSVPYTFGVLADAQARGDLQALQSLGRRCGVGESNHGSWCWYS